MAEHSLDDIVHSIQSAVLAATDIAERHELDSVMQEEFWTKTTDEDGHEIYEPKMVTMEIPMWEDGKMVKRKVPVPLQSLTTGQSLRVDRLEVEMSVEISGLESNNKKGKLMVRPRSNTSWFKKESNTAKLKLVFKGSEPPEGYARIDDQLIKLLP
tara:strand:+ start:37 stop:504 length:468 start_codon:yes stop_codon:yes gene_type:complete